MAPTGTHLKASDFKISGKTVSVRNTNLPGMLLVWGDFCGHCHRFFPTYDKIVSKVQNQFKCMSIESKEFEGNEGLARALKVMGYPSIYFFDTSGKIMYMYQGERDMKSLLKEICKNFHYCLSH